MHILLGDYLRLYKKTTCMQTDHRLLKRAQTNEIEYKDHYNFSLELCLVNPGSSSSQAGKSYPEPWQHAPPKLYNYTFISTKPTT